MPRVCVTSDLHGSLPEIPDCDTLIIAGDVLPDHPIGKTERYKLPDNGGGWQLAWADQALEPWLYDLNARAIDVLAIAGNHDFGFELSPESAYSLPWTYLMDEGTDSNGLSIWGTPWCPGLPRWAFYADGAKMANKMMQIPEGLDILISHGPPYGIADMVGPRYGGPKLVGNSWLNKALDRRRPSVVVTGHIHEAYGSYPLEYGGMLYSVSLNDDAYCPAQPPIILEEFLL